MNRTISTNRQARRNMPAVFARSRRIFASLLAALLPLAVRPALAQTDAQVAQQRKLSIPEVGRLHAIRGLSNEALLRIPEANLRRIQLRLQYPDLPHKRAEFRLLQDRNEQGVILPDARENALQQLEAFRAAAGVPTGEIASPQNLAPPPTSGLNAAHWTSIGPGNVGGRTRSIIIHPDNPQTIWAGSVGGGIGR